MTTDPARYEGAILDLHRRIKKLEAHANHIWQPAGYRVPISGDSGLGGSAYKCSECGEERWDRGR